MCDEGWPIWGFHLPRSETRDGVRDGEKSAGSVLLVLGES